jgi:hypothetical protein
MFLSVVGESRRNLPKRFEAVTGLSLERGGFLLAGLGRLPRAG